MRISYWSSDVCSSDLVRYAKDYRIHASIPGWKRRSCTNPLAECELVPMAPERPRNRLSLAQAGKLLVGNPKFFCKACHRLLPDEIVKLLPCYRRLIVHGLALSYSFQRCAAVHFLFGFGLG